MTQELARRIAIIVALVDRAPQKTIGRTALMKLVYFLGVFKDVELGYRFTLYSYGPFDSEVLQDLDYAKNLGAITSDVVTHARGYGYQLKAGSSAAAAISLADSFVADHQADLGWILDTFGHQNAADLELASTIVYVDRQSKTQSVDDLAKSVNTVKPHFAIGKIKESIVDFLGRGWLKSIEV